MNDVCEKCKRYKSRHFGWGRCTKLNKDVQGSRKKCGFFIYDDWKDVFKCREVEPIDYIYFKELQKDNQKAKEIIWIDGDPDLDWIYNPEKARERQERLKSLCSKLPKANFPSNILLTCNPPDTNFFYQHFLDENKDKEK